MSQLQSPARIDRSGGSFGYPQCFPEQAQEQEQEQEQEGRQIGDIRQNVDKLEGEVLKSGNDSSDNSGGRGTAAIDDNAGINGASIQNVGGDATPNASSVMMNSTSCVPIPPRNAAIASSPSPSPLPPPLTEKHPTTQESIPRNDTTLPEDHLPDVDPSIEPDSPETISAAHASASASASASEAAIAYASASAAIPDFPSFSEWKQKHLASAAAAAAAAKGDAHHGHHFAHGNGKKAGSGNVSSPQTYGDVKRKDAAGRDGIPGSNGQGKDGRAQTIVADAHKQSSSEAERAHVDHEVVPSDSDEVATSESPQPIDPPYSQSPDALSPISAQILQPVPHAGSGDPYLDPLVSLRDRTNYASFDCSATLIRASKSTRGASSILSSKKDRYMLTPCASSDKFVIVELCDEIQIDTVVLANLEFFSSMFKLIRVSAGTAYPENVGRWTELGTFRASNVRGLQVFRPPSPHTSGFHRYIRLDFLSHYGTEYYCPVSILRVYGLTQLDAYRRDQEREARLAEAVENGDADLVVEDLDLLIDSGHSDGLEMQGESPLSEETVWLEMIQAKESKVPDVELSLAEDRISNQEGDHPAQAQMPTLAEAASSTHRNTVADTAHPQPEITNSSFSTRAEAALTPPLQSSTTADNSDASDDMGQTSPQPASQLTSSGMRNSQSAEPVLNRSRHDRQQTSLSGSATRTVPTVATTSVKVPPFSSAVKPTNWVDSSKTSPLSAPSTIVTKKVPSKSSVKSDSTDRPTSSASTTLRPRSASVLSASPKSTANITTQSSASPRTSAKTATSSSSVIYRTVATPVANTHHQQHHHHKPTRNETRHQQQVVYTHSHASNPQPNESIYGTIMKRLLALEVNSTLSTAYIEEHSHTVWETFRKLEERLGGMEKSRVKQDQLLRRLVLDLDLHRAKIEAERMELSSQLSILSKEVVLGKRLTLAQLAALVILLFFVVLTRGSPSTPLLQLAPRPFHAPSPQYSSQPRSARTHQQHGRPRSIQLNGYNLENVDRRDRRTPRDRDKDGSERLRTPIPASAGNPLSRGGSLKRPVRLSGNAKRPMTASGIPAPVRSYTDAGLSRTPLNGSLASPAPISSSISPGSSKLSESYSPGISDAIANIDLPQVSLGQPPIPPDPFLLQTPPPAPLSRSTSPGAATPRGAQSSGGALDSIKRKLKQLRRSSLPDVSTLAAASAQPQIAPMPTRIVKHENTPNRRLFGFGSSTSTLVPSSSVLAARRRGTTISSALTADGDDEGNNSSSKAWLSTSDDSADESGTNMPESDSNAEDKLVQWPSSEKKVRNAKYPPSPDASDADLETRHE